MRSHQNVDVRDVHRLDALQTCALQIAGQKNGVPGVADQHHHAAGILISFWPNGRRMDYLHLNRAGTEPVACTYDSDRDLLPLQRLQRKPNTGCRLLRKRWRTGDLSNRKSFEQTR